MGIRRQSLDGFALSEKYPLLIYDTHEARDVESTIELLAKRLIGELGEYGYHVPAWQNVPCRLSRALEEKMAVMKMHRCAK